VLDNTYHLTIKKPLAQGREV